MKTMVLEGESSWLVKAILRARAAEAARTGLHLSTIVDDFVKTAYPPSRSELAQPVVLALQELGNSLERVIAGELGTIAQWTKPTPRTKDGIICSPDGVSRRSGTLDEMKMRFAFYDPDTFLASQVGWKYQLQILAYCYVWQLTRARLHVLFVRGVKGGAPLPWPVTFIFRFTPQEPKRQWDILKQHAVDRGML